MRPYNCSNHNIQTSQLIERCRVLETTRTRKLNVPSLHVTQIYKSSTMHFFVPNCYHWRCPISRTMYRWYWFKVHHLPAFFVHSPFQGNRYTTRPLLVLFCCTLDGFRHNQHTLIWRLPSQSTHVDLTASVTINTRWSDGFRHNQHTLIWRLPSQSAHVDLTASVTINTRWSDGFRHNQQKLIWRLPSQSTHVDLFFWRLTWLFSNISYNWSNISFGVCGCLPAGKSARTWSFGILQTNRSRIVFSCNL